MAYNLLVLFAIGVTAAVLGSKNDDVGMYFIEIVKKVL